MKNILLFSFCIISSFLHASEKHLEMQDKDGNTPLIQAAANNDLKKLLYHGAQIDHQNNMGYSPLLCALSTGIERLEIVKLLIESGANIFLETAETLGRETALSLTIELCNRVHTVLKQTQNLEENLDYLNAAYELDIISSMIEKQINTRPKL